MGRFHERLERLQKIKTLRQYFLKNLVEDPQDGTKFDCVVLDAFKELERKTREIEIEEAHAAFKAAIAIRKK